MEDNSFENDKSTMHYSTTLINDCIDINGLFLINLYSLFFFFFPVSVTRSPRTP